MSIILPRNHRVPCEKSILYSTARENQQAVTVTVRAREIALCSRMVFLLTLDIVENEGSITLPHYYRCTKGRR
jgi:hypothetical protein